MAYIVVSIASPYQGVPQRKSAACASRESARRPGRCIHTYIDNLYHFDVSGRPSAETRCVCSTGTTAAMENGTDACMNTYVILCLSITDRPAYPPDAIAIACPLALDTGDRYNYMRASTLQRLQSQATWRSISNASDTSRLIDLNDRACVRFKLRRGEDGCWPPLSSRRRLDRPATYIIYFT
jgi:hypothetical protein